MAGLGRWFKTREHRRAVARLWRKAILATARDETPYREGWSEDTLEGRARIVWLVAALVLRRLREAPARDLKLERRLYESLFDMLDDGMREQGVGDASIARKVRGLSEELVGLIRSYDEALDSAATEALADEATRSVLARNGLGTGDGGAGLAVWLREVKTALDGAGDVLSVDQIPERLIE